MAQQHLDLLPGGDKVGEAFGKVEANFGELYALALVVSAIQAALAGKQPLDDDLTAIAAQGTQAFGRSLLAKNSDADVRTLLNLVIGTNVQAWDTDLDAISALTTTAFGRALLTAVDAPSLRSTLALGSAALLTAGSAGGNVPVLDGTGKLLASTMPALAITDVFSVASQAAQVALMAQRGDVAIRTDLGTAFILAADDPTTFANWIALPLPAGVVMLVAGLSGPSITAAQLKTALAIAISDVSGLSTALAGLLSRAGDQMTGALDFAAPVTVASAATADIGAAASNYVEISGTTAITSLGTKAAGAWREVRFQSAGLVLTYNAASLILPTAASITTQAGDTGLFRSLGSGNWRCLAYRRADGSALLGGTKALGSDLRVGTDDVKYLTSKSVYDASAFVGLTDAATIAIDLSTGINFRVTLAGNRTLAAPTNLKDGQSGVIRVKQDATGSRTLTFPSTYLFPGGTKPTLSTAANAVDRFGYVVTNDGSSLLFECTALEKAIA